MGFSTIIDIVGSMIIGGILLLTLFRLNDNAAQNTFNFGNEVNVQENLVGTIEVLEYDFRKIGYCEVPLNIPNPAKAILYADTSIISFLSDVNSDGIVDTVKYYLGSVDDLSDTPNPNDRKLYKIVNGKVVGRNLGITEFRLTYFDALGKKLNTPMTYPPTGINSMQIDIRVESSAGYDNQLQYAYWRQIRLAARNLNNR